MKSSLTVAAVQLTSGENINANADQILSLLNGLTSKVDLICLPENSLYFRINKTTPAPDIRLDDPSIQRLQRFADDQDTAILIGSIPNREGGSLYNSTVFLEPRQAPRVVYRKIHLFDVDVPGAPPARESETFQYGPDTAMIGWRGWKLGLSICYDLRFSELFAQYSRSEVDLILIPAAFLVPTGQAHWEILVRARAIESQCFVVAAAQGGEHVSSSGEKRHTFGHSMIVGPWGEKLMELGGENRVGISQLDKSSIEKVRRQIPMREHRARRRWEV